MNKLFDKKELEKKNGQEAVKDEEPSTDAGDYGKQAMGASLPEQQDSPEETGTLVLRRSELPDAAEERLGNGRRSNDAVSIAPNLLEVFARKGAAEENAKRERIVTKSQNATDFFNLMGWLSKGDPETPIPFRVGKGKGQDAVPGDFVKGSSVREDPQQGGGLSDELPDVRTTNAPELKGASTGLKSSAGGEDSPSAPLRVEKEPLRGASAGRVPTERREEEKPESDERPLPGGVGLDELYTRYYQQDFESLVQNLDTPVKRLEFYNALVEGGRDVGSYADFEAGVSKDLENVLGEKKVRSYRDEQIKALYAMTGGRPQEFQGFRERMDDPANWDGFYREATARGLDLGGYDDFVANLSGSNKKQAEPKESKDGYVGDLLERMWARTLDLNGTIYSAADLVDRATIPPFLDDPTIKRPLRRWADQKYAKADEYRRKSDRYGGKTLEEQWKNGDYLDMIGNLGLELGEAVPDAVLIAVTKGGAAPALIGSSVVEKYDDLNQMPETKDMPELQKAVNVVTTGVVEALVNKFGGKAMGKQFRNLYKNIEKNAVKRDIMKRLSDWIKEVYRKLGILPEAVGGGVEEMVVQIGENITDYTTGVTDEWDPMKGVSESLANGMAEGIVFKRLPGMVKQGMDYRSRERANGDAKPDGLNRASGSGSSADRVPGTDENGRLLLQQPLGQTNEMTLGDGRRSTVNTFGRDVDGMPTDGSSLDRIYEKMEKMDGEITLEESGRMLYGDQAIDRSRGDGKVEIRDEDGNSSLADVKDLKPLHVVDNQPYRGLNKAGEAAEDFVVYQGRKINREDAVDFLARTRLEVDRLSKGHTKDAWGKQMISARIRERKQMMKEIGGLLKSSDVRKNEGGTQPDGRVGR